MPRPALNLLPLLAAAGLLTACRPGEEASASEPLAQKLERREATRVRTAPVLQREMVRVLSTTTNVESARQIDLYPRVAGVVERVLAEEGAEVATGEVLAELDAREAQARHDDALLAVKEAEEQVGRLDLAAAEAEERALSAKLAFDQAASEYERNEKANLISELDLQKLALTRDTNERTWAAAVLTHEGAVRDRAQQALVIERAQLTAAREELALSFTKVSAPFAGVVATRNVRAGDTVSTAAAAFVLTDPDALRCVVPRPQRELEFFQAAREEGGTVEIRVVPEAYPEHEYAGSIEIVSPTIDTDSGSFRLTIGLAQPAADDPRPRLLPGMMVRLSIVTERHPDALAVPKRALRREGDRHFVYVDAGGTAGRVEVQEGFSDDEYVEVVPAVAGALAAGTPVVVVGNRDLEDGEPIEAEAWTPSGERATQPTQDEGEVASAPASSTYADGK